MRAERYALNVARAATVAAPLVLFLALPPFYNGVWVQVEGAMPWLHLAGGVAVLGLCLAASYGNSQALGALRHPLVILPAALFTFSVLLLPFTTLPAMSLFGAPEHGFGALAFLDLAALTAGALVVTVDRGWRWTAVGSALASAAAGFALDLLHRRGLAPAPFFFSDYLAFYAVAAFAMLAVLAGARRVLVAFAFAIFFVLVVLTDNKAALLALVIASALFVVLPREISRRRAVALCVLLPLVVGIAAVLVGVTWQENYRNEIGAVIGFGFIDNAISSLWASLWSRAMLVVVGIQPFVDSPLRLITGIGWGHYNEVLLADLPIVHSRLFELIGESRSYWDAIERSDFHSHNQYLEAVLSTGLVGGLLFLSYGPTVAAYCAPNRRRLALFAVLVLTTLQIFWFQLPHSLPVMAVMTALLATDAEVPRPSVGRGVVGGAIVAGSVLIVAALASQMAASNVHEALKEIEQRDGKERFVWPRFAAGLDEVYDAALLQRSFVALSHATDEAEQERQMEIVHDLLDRAERGGSLRARVTVNNVISGLIFRFPGYEARYGSLSDAYGAAVSRLLDAAPRRSDLAAPYFDYLLAAGRDSDALNLASRILAAQPADLVALWFSGVVLIAAPQTTGQGLRNLRASLDGGVRNLIPIPTPLAEEVRHMTEESVPRH